MKNRARLVGLILILALSACSLPTQAVETPTVEETAVAHSTGETATEVVTEVATEEPSATEAPELPLPIVYGVGEELVVLDPGTGAEINRLTAPGFGYGGNGGVSANGVFYVDSDYQNAYRVGFDGVVQQLLYLNPDGGYFEGVILPSPDGSKIAQGAVLSFDASGSQVQLKVINVDGTGEQILVDSTLDRPLRPTPLKWSADGETLYYVNVIEGIEGYGGQDLIKVDIGTGVSETIFSAAGSLMSTSVSPNELYAARAISGEPLGIVIHDLTTGAEQTVTIPDAYRQVWQMVWATDESALLVTVGLGMFVEGDVYSVLRIDMTTLETSYLVMDDANLLNAVAWQVSETIWFLDSDSTLWKMNAGDLTLTMVATDARFIAISR